MAMETKVPKRTEIPLYRWKVRVSGKGGNRHAPDLKCVLSKEAAIHCYK